MGGTHPGGGDLNELRTQSRLGRIRATAYAKLTLALRVVGARPDGFHDLEALSVSIGQPHDVVEAEAVPHPGGVTFEALGEIEDVPGGRDNLAARAAEELLLAAGRSGHGVRLTLRKRIPAGAGLGGGSADAAATMVALRRMLEIDVDDAGLAALGARLGSDVPFCLGDGAAWMRGRGELLEPVAAPQGLAFLVALPPFRLATADVYRAWDQLGGPRARRVLPAPPAVTGIVAELGNDLEPAAEAIEPGLTEFRADLERVTKTPALLAGSGSAYAVPLEPGRDPAALAPRVRRRLHVPVVGATVVPRGVRLTA